MKNGHNAGGSVPGLSSQDLKSVRRDSNVTSDANSRSTQPVTCREVQQDSAAVKGKGRTTRSIFEAFDARTQLWEAIRAIPERERLILEMRHKNKLTYAQIAERLGMEEDSVRKQWTRTVTRLKAKRKRNH